MLRLCEGRHKSAALRLAMGRRCSLGQFLCSILLLCCPTFVLVLTKTGGTAVGHLLLSWLPDNNSVTQVNASSLDVSQAHSLLPTSEPTNSTSETRMLARIRSGGIRCSDIQSMFPGRIPPVVHWTNRDARVLLPHQEMLRSWLSVLGNSVVYMYWEDKDVEQLISRHYPGLWQHYRNFRTGLLRSDIGRLAIVHHVGGVYTDLDVQLLRSLHPLMHNYTALWSQEPQEHIYFTYGRGRLLSNAVFMSRARHRFLDFLIHSWPGWFHTNWSKQSHILVADVSKAVDATGPMMLNVMLDKYPNPSENSSNADVSLAHPDLFQPTWDSVYAPGHARRWCGNVPAAASLEQRRLCELLRKSQFQARSVPREAFAVHKFMHTSYGGKNSFVNATLAGNILPLSRCVL